MKPDLNLLLTDALDRQAGTPLFRQLYEILRAAILSRQLRAGTRLPSSRELAQETRLSRNTVTAAYEQLRAEGYLVMQANRGAFVAAVIPDEMLQPTVKLAAANPAKLKARRVARRGQQLVATSFSAALPDQPLPRAFQLGMAAIDEFPLALWARLMTRRLRHLPRTALDYQPVAGWMPLREALAAYLCASRGVRCEAAQILIVSGSQQGLDLAARTLLDPGDAAWMEDPGYISARGALISADAKVIPVPLDDEGIVVKKGIVRAAHAQVAYVTPSHQYPRGVVMSLARRFELLEWAAQHGSWVIEDDYDSEFRYADRPLAALQGLDRQQRVIYIGTFSKVLFPSLRLGYVVAPPDLVDTLSAVLAHMTYHAPLLEQMVLADFITEGHFARHIRRMRTLYAERQAFLLKTAARELSGLLEVLPKETGMHLLGWLPKSVDDRAAFQQALAHRVFAPPLSFYCQKAKLPPALLLGYTGVNEHEIQQGIKRLRQALVSLRT